ncbi:MAG TPA: TPM domain-containing protein [Sphingomicrobium sp.]|nr:TPM domain-containing protein [Sphingomicrobium sp.]
MNLIRHREERGDVAIQQVLDCFAALAVTVLLFIASPVAAQTFPANNGSPVVDQAGILTPAQVVDLRSKSQALYAQSGRAFAVATVKSLEGYPVDDYAYRLLRNWKLGSAKEDDGVLLVVAPTERKVAITTGYGAGEYMTDAMSGLIIRQAILPHFKQNPPDYGGGVEAGADAIIKQMSVPAGQARENTTAAQQTQRQRQHSGGGALPLIFWLFVIGFVVLSRLRRVSGRRYQSRRSGISPWVVLWGLNELGRGSRGGSNWGGGGWGGGGWGGGGFGSGGGGFGGFGGGSGGGGGASGSW